MARWPRRCALFLFLVLFDGRAVARADDPIDTNRPNVTESPRVLASGYLQLESGWTRFMTEVPGSPDATADAFGEVLLRQGLGTASELRVFAPTRVRFDVDGGDAVNEWAPFALGAKQRLTAQGASWSSAIVGTLGLPGGSGPLKRRLLDPGVSLVAGHGFGSLEIDANAGAGLSGNPGSREWSENAAVALLFPVRKGVNAYVEYYVLFVKDVDPAGAADAGLTFPLRNDFQLDVRYGMSLSTGPDQHYVGAGFAKRWGSRAPTYGDAAR